MHQTRSSAAFSGFRQTKIPEEQVLANLPLKPWYVLESVFKYFTRKCVCSERRDSVWKRVLRVPCTMARFKRSRWTGCGSPFSNSVESFTTPDGHLASVSASQQQASRLAKLRDVHSCGSARPLTIASALSTA